MLYNGLPTNIPKQWLEHLPGQEKFMGSSPPWPKVGGDMSPLSPTLLRPWLETQVMHRKVASMSLKHIRKETAEK